MNLQIDISRAILQRIVFMFFLLVFAVNYVSDVSLHQLKSPILKYPGIDRTYWLFGLSGMPQFLAGNYITALILDIGLILAAAGACVFAASNRFPILFILLYGLYFLTAAFYTGHYNNVGVLFMAIPFIVKGESRFANFFSAIRYYFLFIMVSAAVWKLFRGTLFDVEHFSNVLKAQHVEYFIFNQDSWRPTVLFYLINHPQVAYLCWLGLFLLQVSFAIGLFTGKFDRWLLLVYFLFYLGSFFLMNITAIENVALLFTLTPLTRLSFRQASETV